MRERYFEWLISKVCDERHMRYFTNVLWLLFCRRYEWHISRDVNRSSDGVELRHMFAAENGYDIDYVCNMELGGPCNILEMMVALALKCETNIMHNEAYGDRTSKWFWKMMKSLGLDGMDDGRIDDVFVNQTIDNFIRGAYSHDGEGGLFYIPNSVNAMPKMELWLQLNAYLDYLFKEGILNG